MINRRQFISITVLSTGMCYLPPSMSKEGGDKGDQEHTLIKNATRSIKVGNPYLNLPVRSGGPSRTVRVISNGDIVREFDISLADDDRADWWAFLDLLPFKGQSITIQVSELPKTSRALKLIYQADQIEGAQFLYREARRPQFHFSTRRGTLGDANGLVFYQGEYHLFYQHYPFATSVVEGMNASAHWGHAVSRDLVHWKELPVALYPDANGAIWSGSAAVDWNNTAGFQTGKEKTLIALYTAAHVDTLLTGKGLPYTQALAYSNDRGRTWSKYRGNPVLPHVAGTNRDPRVFWYAPEKKWVMVLYLDMVEYAKRTSDSEIGNMTKMGSAISTYALFCSPNLEHWEKTDEFSIKGEAECPELFEMALDGNRDNTRWIAQGASGKYVIGSFDGKRFKTESEPQLLNRGNAWFAPQTFNDIPATDGRRILVPWAQFEDNGALYKDMPFTEMMGLPVELNLRTTETGPRLFAYPVKEVKALRARAHKIEPQALMLGANPLAEVKGELFDIEAEITPVDSREISFKVRASTVTYDVKKQELSCGYRVAPLKMNGGKIRLRMLADRTSLEIFGNEGLLYMSMGVYSPPDDTSLALSVQSGSARIDSLEVFELQSIWS